MLPQQDDQRNQPATPLPSVSDSTDEATHYGATPPADDEATNYGAAAPTPGHEAATRYGEQTADPDQTNYQGPPPSGDASATYYPAGSGDPHATGYTPTGSRPESPSGKRLSRCFSGYELLEEIGHGGMGVVYKVRQVALDRLVALKMIRSGELACEADVRHFRVEANEAARLDHPNIVPVYEVGEQQGHHYFTMKLIEGGSLDRQLDHFRNDRKAAARLVATVARAVHHAHQRQLLHRDLKPGNILLDAEGQPHVADFGLAKRMGSEGDASQSVGVGTPEYMAPEQARGERLTTAADVYALGGILYALLTGRPPFRGASHWETIQQLLSQAPAAPSKYAPGCPRDLETICLKCLDKDPARRYGSAEALAEELERWLKGEPVRARPIGKLQRAWRWCRRDPALAGALVALVVTVLGSLAGVTLMYLKAERQRQLAEHREAEARAVTRFYEDHVLAAARPKGWEGGVGKDVTLKGTLDQAAPSIKETFAGQPELEAAVRNTLGMTYYYLGQFEDASPHLEKAHAIRLQVMGPDHPDTLASLHNLAMDRWKQGKWKEALTMIRRAVEGRRRVLGPEHQDTLWSQLWLGLLLDENGHLDEAEVVLRQAIESCKGTLGPDHRYTLHGQNDLAIVLWEKGKQEESVALDRQTLEGRRRSLGPDHPDTLRSMGNLAYSLMAMGKLEEAEPWCRQSLEGRRRVLGPEHIETLWSEGYLGELLGRKGNYREAEEVLRHDLEVCRRSLGPNHIETGRPLSLLGEVLTNAGRPAEAEPLLRECLVIREKNLSPGHWLSANVRSLLGQCLARQDKFAQAEPLLLAGYEGLAKAAPVPTITKALNRVIELYEKWDKPDQVEVWRKKQAVFVAQPSN